MPSAPLLSIGLYFDEHIAGVEVFTEIKGGGKKFTLWNEKAICLGRGCCVYWTPKWGSSFLISKSLKILEEYYKGEPRYVMAYSDWDAGEIGTVYQACNWIYIGHKNIPEWRSPEGRRYDFNHHRNLSRKKDKDFKTKKKIKPEIVEQTKQELLLAGWTRGNTIRGCYVTVIGYNSKEKQRLQKLLLKHSKTYPKVHI